MGPSLLSPLEKISFVSFVSQHTLNFSLVNLTVSEKV